MNRGWWTLKIEGVDELNDADREHIGQKITEGYTSGEIVQEDDPDIANADQFECMECHGTFDNDDSIRCPVCNELICDYCWDLGEGGSGHGCKNGPTPQPYCGGECHADCGNAVCPGPAEEPILKLGGTMKIIPIDRTNSEDDI